MNCGSLLILNVSTRCGLSPNASQIRPTVDLDSPVSAAIDARDQCVASLGWRSSVATSTASTCSSVIVRGAPGRGSSDSPSSRRSMNRRRQIPTVCGHTPTSAATSLLDLPAAQPNTMRHRCANACADDARRAHRCSVSRSSSDNTNAATGLPIRAINQAYTNTADSWRRTLGGSVLHLQDPGADQLIDRRIAHRQYLTADLAGVGAQQRRCPQQRFGNPVEKRWAPSDVKGLGVAALRKRAELAS